MFLTGQGFLFRLTFNLEILKCLFLSVAGASVHILSTVEENLRSWISVLPARIREDILINVSKLLIGNFGTVSYRSQHHTYNPLPVFIASSFEILYDVSFNSLNICNDLQWNKDSRAKVLHLVHKNLNTGVQHINFACYKVSLIAISTVMVIWVVEFSS